MSRPTRTSTLAGTGAKRHWACWAFAAALLSSIDGSLALATAQGMDSAEMSTLHVRLTLEPTLSQETSTALIREATAIWRRSRVPLMWETGSAKRAAAGPDLCVLVVAGPPLNGALTVGELFRVSRDSAVAVASIDRARQIVAETRPSGPILPVRWGDVLLDVVLGRAVAHEIGHVLLGTAAHTNHGLMRARFAATEFVDLRSDAFSLDRDAAASLAKRMQAGMLSNVTEMDGAQDR